MLRHGDVWAAIDRLAQENGLSTSGLARRAGLDPTTFNKSKRTTAGGKLRWPSTESVSKILQATSCSLGEFVSYIEQSGGVVQRIPIIGLAQAGSEGFFDDAGFPVGEGWDQVEFPNIGDPHSYALEISGDSMEPVYRDGDTVIVSPGAGIRRFDRVVVKTLEGEVMAKVLQRRTASKLELLSINTAHPLREIPIEAVSWIHRIVWASQ